MNESQLKLKSFSLIHWSSFALPKRLGLELFSLQGSGDALLIGGFSGTFMEEVGVQPDDRQLPHPCTGGM